jgi:hypothetical protein
MGAWGESAGTVTGLADRENLINILAYPNPTTGAVFIQSLPDGHPKEMQLFNSLGRMLFSTIITEDAFLLDLSSYPQGMYLLLINTASTRDRVLLVKE